MNRYGLCEELARLAARGARPLKRNGRLLQYITILDTPSVR